MAKRLAQLWVMVALMAALCLTAQPAHAGTVIWVNTDEGFASNNGNCSLVEAIQSAQLDQARDECPPGSGTDTINFDIGTPGSSHTIAAGTGFTLTHPVIIDGTSQPGYIGTPLIRISGEGTSATMLAFNSGSAGSAARGLMLTGYMFAGVNISTGDSVEHVTLTGNYIGTDGTSQLGSSFGVYVDGGKYAQIGGPLTPDRNLISGNSTGVGLGNGADHNTIQGNYICLNGSGALPVDGSLEGIVLTGATLGASYNVITGNKIGCLDRGIWIYEELDTGTVIQSNYIGTNAAGTTAAAASLTMGIELAAGDGTVIGGSLPGQGNVISGAWNGIQVGILPTNTTILGNLIGTDKDGTAAIPNTQFGIYLDHAAVNIGDADSPGHNLISGNTGIAGIGVSGSPLDGITTIVGNRIGVNLAGNGYLPNPNGITINGDAAPMIAENWIASNTGAGISSGSGGTVNSLSTLNCIVGNGSGAINYTAIPADLGENWWGDASGPTVSSNPEGTGDSVSTTWVSYAPWLVSAPAACGNGGGTYDGDHTAWSYTGTWIGVPIAGLYDDSLQVGAMTGGTASLTFNGSGFTLNYLRIPGWGNIGVYLDGAVAPVTTINTNGAVALLMYKSPALIPGTHTVILRHAGPAGTMVAFDSLEVWAPLAVKSGWKIDPSNVEWNYTGTWVSIPAAGLYNETLHIGLSAAGAATLFFNGTGFRLSYLEYTGWGKIVVIVDGSVVQVIDTNGSPSIQTYDSPVLTSGPHSVILYNLGPAGKFIGIDALEIFTIMV